MVCAVLDILGHPSTALSNAHDFLTAARRSSDPSSIANALFNDCMRHVQLRDSRMVAERADEMISIATEHEMPYFSLMGTFFRGWAMAAAGRGDEGIAEMRQSISDPTVAGFHIMLLATLAETCGNNARADEGLDLVAKGLATAELTGHRMAEAELHRLKGKLLLVKSLSNVAEAERCLRTAIDVARRQGAKLFELRATVSLARLLRDTNRRDEARMMLVDIYNWFTEGFDPPDLKEAKALIEELSPLGIFARLAAPPPPRVPLGLRVEPTLSPELVPCMKPEPTMDLRFARSYWVRSTRTLLSTFRGCWASRRGS
jgi:predicted ATPase